MTWIMSFIKKMLNKKKKKKNIDLKRCLGAKQSITMIKKTIILLHFVPFSHFLQ